MADLGPDCCDLATAPLQAEVERLAKQVAELAAEKAQLRAQLAGALEELQRLRGGVH